MDPFFEKEIKLSNDIYLIQDAGIDGYALAFKNGQNYFEVMLGPTVIEVISFDKTMYVSHTNNISKNYYKVDLNGQNYLAEIAENDFKILLDSKKAIVLYRHSSLN
jgi:hypothetical protein